MIKVNIYLELKNKFLSKSLENILLSSNYIDYQLKRKKKIKYFVYFNNYNYNEMYFIGEVYFFKKSKIFLKNKGDNLCLKLLLNSPIIFCIYKL